MLQRRRISLIKGRRDLVRGIQDNYFFSSQSEERILLFFPPSFEEAHAEFDDDIKDNILTCSLRLISSEKNEKLSSEISCWSVRPRDKDPMDISKELMYFWWKFPYSKHPRTLPFRLKSLDLEIYTIRDRNWRFWLF